MRKMKRFLCSLLAIVMLVGTFAVLPEKAEATGNNALRASEKIQVYSQWDADAYGKYDNRWICGSGCGLLSIGHALQWLGIISRDQENENSTIGKLFEESGFIGTVLVSERKRTLQFLANKYSNFKYDLNAKNLVNIINNGGNALLSQYGHQYLAVDLSTDGNYVHIIDSCLLIPSENNVKVFQYNQSSKSFYQVSVSDCAVRSDQRWYCSDVTTSNMVKANNPNKLYSGGDYWVELSEVSGNVYCGLYSSHTHSYTSSVTKAPTCTATGVRTYSCSCGASYTESIPATGHTAVTDNAVAATCTTSGLTAGSHCSVCGTVLSAQNVIPALGHTYGEWDIIKYPSYSETGLKKHICSVCSYEETEVIHVLIPGEPIYSEWSEEYPEGIDESLIETKIQYKSSEKETTTSDKSDLPGYSKYDTKLTSWGAWSNWSTTNPSNGTRNVESRSVYDHTEYHYYRWTNGTGVYTYKYNNGYWLEEKWFSYELSSTSMYNDIYYEGSDTSRNWWVRADAGYNHDFTNDKSFTRTVNRTEWRYQEPVYTYYYFRWTDFSDWQDDVIIANDNTRVETRTVYRYLTNPHEHTPAEAVSENVVQPTCTTAGSYDKVVYCSECNEEISRETITVPALGHDFGEWTITKAPTVSEPGLKQRVCSRDASHVETEEIVPLPDPNAPALTVGSITAVPGETVTVSVSIKNNPGIAGMVLTPVYDTENFTLTKVTKGDLGFAVSSSKNITFDTDGENETDNGILVNLMFVVSDSAILGQYEIGVTVREAVNADWQNVSLVVENGYIEVEEESQHIHSPAEAVIENTVQPTCTSAGSYDTVIYCSECEEELSRETVTTNALEHDLGAWTVIKAATASETGLEQRTCSRCDYVESKTIPKLNVISGTVGTNLSWTLSGSTLTISGTGAMKNFASKTSMPWYDYMSQIQRVVIGNGITNIGNYAFMGGSNIKGVTLGNAIASIGINAFSGCSKLKELVLPASANDIRKYAFNNCTSLEMVVFNCNEVPTLSANAFTNSAPYLIYKASWGDFDKGNHGGGDAVFIVDHISGKCGATSYSLDRGAMTISGTGSIRGYSKGEAPWYNYRREILSLTLGSGVTSIGNYAFYDCRLLEDMDLGNVQSINTSAFYGCLSLKRVTFPETLTTLGSYAFSNCSYMKQFTFEGDTAPTIAKTAFNTVKAKAVYNAGSGWDSFAKSGFGGAVYWTNDADEEILGGICGNQAAWMLIDGTLTIYGEKGTKGYSSKTDVPWYEYREQITKIVVEDGITSLGNYQFMGCENVTEVYLSNTLTFIGVNAFSTCSKLTTITIPATVNTINGYAFNKCSGLQNVIFEGDKPATLAGSAFANTSIKP